MKQFNILILSAGRRVELVLCFKNAANKLGINAKIIAADASELAPALYFADQHVKLPLISDHNYIPSIIDACVNHSVDLIVPTIDTDLLLLSQNQALIEQSSNAKLLISNADVIEVCRNKHNTQRFFEEHHIPAPKAINVDQLNGDMEFPVFIKPAAGSSSINAYKANDLEELHTYVGKIKDPIIQEFVEGEEYSVDVFLDFESNIITVVPRLRLSTRSGEIAKGKIVKDQEIIANVKRLMEELRPVGHITVQLIKTKRGIKYIEINPRFGGGAPMSIKSGADSCENLFRLLAGEKLHYKEDYKDKLTFLRFDSSICLDSNLELLEL